MTDIMAALETAAPGVGYRSGGARIVVAGAVKSGGRKRPAAGWASLTPAELQVVRLVREGLRNDAIARQLFIAPGTVKVHLSHIFAKLGITTRTELAAQAASQGLAADRPDSLNTRSLPRCAATPGRRGG